MLCGGQAVPTHVVYLEKFQICGVQTFRRCGAPVCVCVCLVGGRQLVKQGLVPCSDSNCAVKSDLALYTHVMAKG